VNKQKNPPQLENLFPIISECIEQGKYTLTEHAIQRLGERNITLKDAEYVLKNGYHEKKKSSFDEAYRTWKYAIRGKTIENLDIRIIIAFDKNDMIVITLMHVGEELK
jgi:3-deoxy-D-manno-octulosonic acid (KDO) 8-phosphate synthase